MESVFKTLYETNVNEHIDRKGAFAYLSWPYAIAQLRLADPSATWEVRRFENLPYQKTELGVFVEVSVTVQGITLSQIHPVLDAKNKPLMEPSAFDINTSIQRCLVKSVALHGLGLYIYAGEDLPQGETNGEAVKPVATIKPPHLTKQKGVVLLTDNQLRFITKLIKETKTNEQQLLTFFGVEALEFIPKSEVNRVITVLENNREAA